MLYKMIRPALFLSDAESAHLLSLAALKMAPLPGAKPTGLANIKPASVCVNIGSTGAVEGNGAIFNAASDNRCADSASLRNNAGRIILYSISAYRTAESEKATRDTHAFSEQAAILAENVKRQAP